MNASSTDDLAFTAQTEARAHTVPDGSPVLVAETAARPGPGDGRPAPVVRASIPYDVVKQRLFRMIRAS